MNLERFSRVALCHLPTSLEPLDRLTQHLGGARLFVKRDDCTGLALGGNKARKLEFLLADALERGADTVVTIGGLQSNHCRQTAAAAAKLGLRCELILPHLSRFASSTYDDGGNVLLDRLLGAKLHVVHSMEEAATKTREVLDAIRARGDTPYFIPAGGSTALGALGYVEAAFELGRQATERALKFDHVVVTTGSSTTHAGLVVGFAAVEQSAEFELRPTIHGISVYQRREPALATVRQRARETADLLELNIEGLDERVRVNDDYLGRGYGEPTAAMVEAVGLGARLEGLLVDPVYTGKTLAGAIDLVRTGFFSKDENVLFWHTGGIPALFAYREAFDELLEPTSRQRSE
jgi:L-cysteate sulfo-lyase